MRIASICLLALTACGPLAAPHAELPEVRAAVAGPWFICDGVDAPVVFVFAAPENQRTHILQVDKATGQRLFDGDVDLGAEQGAAGSVYTTLMLDGAEAGAIRRLNTGMLETPGAAYTTPFSSVSFRGVQSSCRWMPRTRLLGVTDRRSLLVYEGDDGDLIYTTYDFASAAQQSPIQLSNNGRSTTFSAETRGGEENLSPNGVAFNFTAPQHFAYRVFAARDGQGRVEVLRDGAVVQTEPLIAFQLGAAEE